jgi:hypothetical protein
VRSVYGRLLLLVAVVGLCTVGCTPTTAAWRGVALQDGAAHPVGRWELRQVGKLRLRGSDEWRQYQARGTLDTDCEAMDIAGSAQADHPGDSYFSPYRGLIYSCLGKAARYEPLVALNGSRATPATPISRAVPDFVSGTAYGRIRSLQVNARKAVVAFRGRSFAVFAYGRLPTRISFRTDRAVGTCGLNFRREEILRACTFRS